MLVKQLIVFILPIAVEGSDEEGVEQKKNKKKQCERWAEDNSCWLENASWLLKANAFAVLQPSLRVHTPGRRGGGGMRGYREEEMIGDGESERERDKGGGGESLSYNSWARDTCSKKIGSSLS